MKRICEKEGGTNTPSFCFTFINRMIGYMYTYWIRISFGDFCAWNLEEARCSSICRVSLSVYENAGSGLCFLVCVIEMEEHVWKNLYKEQY